MEPKVQKTLEREISQRALQMSNSFPCQICVVGFLFGVSFTYLFLAALSSFGTVELGGFSFLNPSNSSSMAINMGGSKDYDKEIGRTMNVQKKIERISKEERVMLLNSAWSVILNKPVDNNETELLRKLGLSRTQVPEAPHLENCKLTTQVNHFLDTRKESEAFPRWAHWKGSLGMKLLQQKSNVIKEQQRFERKAKSRETYPPWIVGSDEDNFPLTRKVQHDIWNHQHPLNCSDPEIRFLIADWETLPGFGIGAQLAGMFGLLAIAINEKRVLVTNYFNRADHDGCEGDSRNQWSCYFFPETSIECRDRALDLMKSEEAWSRGIIKGKQNYSSKEIWSGKIPKIWGNPWLYLQPTTEINGSLVRHHRNMDRRWWRAQAVRYFMRFQTEYTCDLLNIAQHTSFGLEAAEMVIESLPGDWPETILEKPQSDMEQYVWSDHKPWIPRPLLSMHVRMGDKACEMKVVQFEEYMRLADKIRKRFPNLNRIWLSTEMQDVIDKSRSYTNWKFYYTNITRQVGNKTMASYEASLGRETSTNYPVVNFLMATEADFFIGALGSTWCFLIDGMRNTGGKVMAGYLSVNRDRFW